MNELQMITKEEQNDLRIIVTGKLSSVDAMTFKKESQAIVSASSKDVVMDLSHVTEFDIAGLNAVLQAHRNLKSRGVKLQVISMLDQEVSELFSLTQFDQYLTVLPAA